MSFVIGREVAFTYTSGPETYVTTKFNMCAYRESRRDWPTTPPGYIMNRDTPGILTAEGLLGNWYDSADATPPTPGGNSVPSGTVGTFVITLTTGKTKTFKGSVWAVDWNQSMEGGGPPITWQMRFKSNAQSASDTIVTA